MDRPYSRFTENEKAVFRSMYQDMPESDEPPFPEHGLRDILESLARLAGNGHINDEVSIYVTVDATGAATNVDLVEYADVDNAKAVAYVLVKAKYKPAKCGGEPCTMQWPFRVKLLPY
ncbi:energy transducer TonB [Niveibacterium sp. COAC-50]|uniref:energy transducer TonB n=1 Tax=Niveibacterium sp. COAC-50 TaxID=2729384 RepID=UPI001557EBCB|nr:hypothetical protein [Niveibacterium sp. COAC-50]